MQHVSSDDDLKGYLQFVLMSWRNNDQTMCISSLSKLLATTEQSVIEFPSLRKCFVNSSCNLGSVLYSGTVEAGTVLASLPGLFQERLKEVGDVLQLEGCVWWY